MRVLVACEMSGRVRHEFAKRGWEAWSADLLDTEIECTTIVRLGSAAALRNLRGTTEVHYLGDVRDLFDPWHWANAGRSYPVWDLVIAHPPCTDLSLAGARFWKEKQADGRQERAASFFMDMMNAPSRHVAVENPRGVMSRLFRKPDQVVEPWWFGDPYAKATCLWLRGLPPLVADNPVEPVGRVATGGGSWKVDKAAERKAMNSYEDSEGRARRAIVRSRTFPGFARAAAEQWGSYLEGLDAQ